MGLPAAPPPPQFAAPHPLTSPHAHRRARLPAPFSFHSGVKEVIRGWDLAIMEMKAGETRQLVIPSDLGYGPKGAGGKIPGGATLFFDVTLIELGGELRSWWGWHTHQHPLFMCHP